MSERNEPHHGPVQDGPGEGWHPVAAEEFDLRYHDGAQWTSWVSTNKQVHDINVPPSQEPGFEPAGGDEPAVGAEAAGEADDVSTLAFAGVCALGWLLLVVGLFAGSSALMLVGLALVLVAAFRWRIAYRAVYAARAGGTAGQRAGSATKNLATGVARNGWEKSKVRRSQRKNAMNLAAPRVQHADGSVTYRDGTPVASLSGGTPGGGAFRGSGYRLGRSFRRSVLWTLKCATVLPAKDGIAELRRRSANKPAGPTGDAAE